MILTHIVLRCDPGAPLQGDPFRAALLETFGSVVWAVGAFLVAGGVQCEVVDAAPCSCGTVDEATEVTVVAAAPATAAIAPSEASDAPVFLLDVAGGSDGTVVLCDTESLPATVAQCRARSGGAACDASVAASAASLAVLLHAAPPLAASLSCTTQRALQLHHGARLAIAAVGGPAAQVVVAVSPLPDEWTAVAEVAEAAVLAAHPGAQGVVLLPPDAFHAVAAAVRGGNAAAGALAGAVSVPRESITLAADMSEAAVACRLRPVRSTHTASASVETIESALRAAVATGITLHPGGAVSVAFTPSQAATLLDSTADAAAADTAVGTACRAVSHAAQQSDAHPAHCVHFTVESLQGGPRYEAGVTALSVADKPGAAAVPSTPSVGCCASSPAVRATLRCRSAHTDALAALVAPGGGPRIVCLHGTAANGGAVHASLALADLGLPAVVADAALADDATLLTLCRFASHCPCAAVVRHSERLDAGGAFARTLADVAAAPQRWAQLLDPEGADEEGRALHVVLVFEESDPPPPFFDALADAACSVPPPSDDERLRLLAAALATAAAQHHVLVSPLLDLEAVAAWCTGLAALDIVTWAHTAVAQAASSVAHATGGGEARAVVSAGLLEESLQQYQRQHGHVLTSTKLQPVKWGDVGGLEEAKRDILETIQLPLQRPDLFSSGAKRRGGILMYGPPGCGKTLLAKAVATELGLNFISVKGPELINMYVGESERNIRDVFQRARDNSPCVVFFDELDALAPARGAKGDSGGVMDRIVAQLLAEVDGVGQTKSDGTAAGAVFIVGATNRPDLLDSSLLRPGRFDKLCYLGPPATKDEQLSAVKALTRKFDLAPDVDLAAVVAGLEPVYTGADYYALCADAMMAAVDDTIAALTSAEDGVAAPAASPGGVPVAMAHFERALGKLKPSVTPQDLRRYEAMKTSFAP